MRLNILIALAIGFATYGLTLYLDGSAPSVTQVPVSVSVSAPASGEIAPDFTFTDTKNRTQALRDFKGKTIILNFWASWCPPCLKEFPLLLEAAAQHKKDVVFIALSSDHAPEDMNRFLAKLNLEAADNVYIALDKNTAITGDIFQTFRLPETILIDSEQRLREKLIGADWRAQDLATMLEAL